MTITNLVSYQNGNTYVTIKSDGTKTREYEGIPVVNHPESIDVKITDYCDMGCKYCHESSTKAGKHGNSEFLLNILSDLPKGVELAIGGGNPLSHPNLVWLLRSLKDRGFICNLTVNQGHLKPNMELLVNLLKQDLVKGLGISITNNNFTYVSQLLNHTSNIVFHIIAGVNSPNIVEDLLQVNPDSKILLLGYKTFGFGIGYYDENVENSLKLWNWKLPQLVKKCTFSFDNLAIEQLDVKRLFTQEGWNKFYMGDDFTFTMYIDAVKQEYAPTSRSGQRVPFSEMSLLDYFNNFKL